MRKLLVPQARLVLGGDMYAHMESQIRSQFNAKWDKDASTAHSNGFLHTVPDYGKLPRDDRWGRSGDAFKKQVVRRYLSEATFLSDTVNKGHTREPSLFIRHPWQRTFESRNSYRHSPAANRGCGKGQLKRKLPCRWHVIGTLCTSVHRWAQLSA